MTIARFRFSHYSFQSSYEGALKVAQEQISNLKEQQVLVAIVCPKGQMIDGADLAHFVITCENSEEQLRNIAATIDCFKASCLQPTRVYLHFATLSHQLFESISSSEKGSELPGDERVLYALLHPQQTQSAA